MPSASLQGITQCGRCPDALWSLAGSWQVASVLLNTNAAPFTENWNQTHTLTLIHINTLSVSHSQSCTRRTGQKEGGVVPPLSQVGVGVPAWLQTQGGNLGPLIYEEAQRQLCPGSVLGSIFLIVSLPEAVCRRRKGLCPFRK